MQNCEFEGKLVPLTVSVNCALPAATELGLRLVITGVVGATMKENGADVPPAVVTVSLTGPGVVIKLAGTTAERVALCKKVVTDYPGSDWAKKAQDLLLTIPEGAPAAGGR